MTGKLILVTAKHLAGNTVPNIGILLAYYWRRTGAVFYGSTGETLK